MFTDFFFTLRKRKVPVSITEWMTLVEALDKGYIEDLDDFYYLARAILVKSEAYYDHYDVAFQEYFKGVEAPVDISDEIRDWLKDPLAKMLADLKKGFHGDQFDDLDKLMEELEKRLKEQTEQHNGGGHWIGRGGTSPFGHSGYNPHGIRIGGERGGGHAVKVAAERRYRNYRNDLTLDVRQIRLALKGLRKLSRTGPEDELNLEKTIQATAKNLGDLELIWQRARRNSVKLLLLMDVGGSMEPFALLCSQLFSAAHSSGHFRDFQYYYFHNCPYESLYKDVVLNTEVSTEYLLQNLDPEYKLIMVGDATMGPWELTERWGAIDFYYRNEAPGIVWIKRLSNHFSHNVWLNPMEQREWLHPTVQAIGKFFPMYPLTVEGLEQAVRKLVVKR